MSGEVHLLTVTSLYPSTARPRHGIFIESRLERIVRRGGLRAHVVTPVPWFPFAGERWGEYGRIASTPASETRKGIPVSYPRFLSLPGIDGGLKPRLMAHAGRRAAEGLLRAGVRIDVIDAHYLYPDGVAAAYIARQLGRPLVLSARGSDVNVVAQMAGPRRRILQAIDMAGAVVAVSAALKAALVSLGAPADRITVLRNGVDLTMFRPEDRIAARRRLGLPLAGPVLASVGNLVEEKRPDLFIEAAARLAGAHAVLVGRGPLRPALEQLATARGVRERLSFLEEMPQDELRWLYSSADVLVISSEREGWPNVILEAAACGTPVVAFPVGGVPEIVSDPDIGALACGERSPEILADVTRRLLADPPSVQQVRSAASRFAWEPVLAEQLALYRRVAKVGQAVRGFEVAAA